MKTGTIVKEKITQGQLKTNQRLSELFQRKSFLAKIHKIKNIADKKKQFRYIFALARNYSLQFEPGEPLFEYVVSNMKKISFKPNHYMDICQIYDEVDEYLNLNFPNDYSIPPSKKPAKKLELYAYPIHLGISQKATKRDVLDYIHKRWHYIRYMLDAYEENPKGIRKKRKLYRDEFIWKYKHLPAKQIADKVQKNFPGELLTYHDINHILFYLHKRKS